MVKAKEYKRLSSVILVIVVLLGTWARAVEYWEEKEKLPLSSSQVSAGDRFGRAVGIDGDYAVVGAYGVTSNTGKAYIFKRDGGSWILDVGLPNPNEVPNDHFGGAAGVSGPYCIVGCEGKDTVVGSDAGAAYIYERNAGGVWEGPYRIIPESGYARAGDGFGKVVAIDGIYAVVGAWFDDDNGIDAGAAYIFERTATGWEQRAKLKASNGISGDRFGGAVSISGDCAVVGAYWHEGPAGDNSGSAYVFVKPETGWVDMTETSILSASDNEPGDEFGVAVCVNDDVVLVGAWGENDGIGSAYLFEKPGNGWISANETAKLTPSDGSPGGMFGMAVSTSENVALIASAEGPGAVYGYVKPETGWASRDEDVKLLSSDGSSGDNFGVQISISGDSLIAGAYGHDYDLKGDSGAAYIFEPLGNEVVFPNGGEELIAGQTATIEWSSSLTADSNVVLEYSTDNGGEWTDIGIATNTGSYEWPVPEITSNQCLVRITAADNPGLTDTSDDVFTIYVCRLSGAAADADLDDNCKVDFTDFSIWSQQWLKNGNPFDPNYTGQPPYGEEMVLIPTGQFEMGDHFNEGRAEELPVHTVTVNSFYIAGYQITNREYCDYLDSALSRGLITVTSGVVYKAGSGTDYPYCDTSTSSGESQIAYDGDGFSVRTKSGRDMSNDPMVTVSWYGAVAYCNWRSREEGREQCYDLSTWDCDFSKKGYRLPTEAEWEYAARGGLDGERFPWGHTISHSQANYWSQMSPSYDVNPTQGFHPDWNDGVYPYTSVVGSFPGNAYGLYDMAGNVYDWCNDWWDPEYYDNSPTDNPRGPIAGTYRIHRGGAWNGNAHGSRVALRGEREPGSRLYSIGFRLSACADGGAEPVAFHVDGVIGDDGNDGLTHQTAFETIQKGIDSAANGNVVLVWPGVYAEQISFGGKAITVRNADYPAVIETPWLDAVSFHFGEGAGSVLSNFVIRGSMTAIACNNGSRPTLRNLTIVGNQFGIASYENSQPDIVNCILWGNQYGDLYQCEARYSCVEYGSAGPGCISLDPLLADMAGGNYHPLSEYGRYVPAYGLWAFDELTSPCIDRGDPSDDPADERMPNGNRINMGAYAGTGYASMGQWAA